MALQTSGQITISDIKTELGSTSNSLEALSLDASLSAPHAMSDFYGYSAATQNLYYWNFGENDGGAKLQVMLGLVLDLFLLVYGSNLHGQLQIQTCYYLK